MSNVPTMFTQVARAIREALVLEAKGQRAHQEAHVLRTQLAHQDGPDPDGSVNILRKPAPQPVTDQLHGSRRLHEFALQFGAYL
jgi:hypothetical protein